MIRRGCWRRAQCEPVSTRDAKVGASPRPGRNVGRGPLLERRDGLSRRYGDAACQRFVPFREHHHSSRREPTPGISLPEGHLYRAPQGSLHSRVHNVLLPVSELPHGVQGGALSHLLPNACLCRKLSAYFTSGAKVIDIGITIQQCSYKSSTLFISRDSNRKRQLPLIFPMSLSSFVFSQLMHTVSVSALRQRSVSHKNGLSLSPAKEAQI